MGEGKVEGVAMVLVGDWWTGSDGSLAVAEGAEEVLMCFPVNSVSSAASGSIRSVWRWTSQWRRASGSDGARRVLVGEVDEGMEAVLSRSVKFRQPSEQKV